MDFFVLPISGVLYTTLAAIADVATDVFCFFVLESKSELKLLVSVKFAEAADTLDPFLS